MRLSAGQEFQAYLRKRFVPEKTTREKTPVAYAEKVDRWLARSFFTLLGVGLIGIPFLAGTVSVWFAALALPWVIVLFMIVDFANHFEENYNKSLTEDS